MSGILLSVISSLLLVGSGNPDTGDHAWSQWRGPERSGISHETEWTLAGTELWKASVGMGYSAFSIIDGRLFTLGYDSDEETDVVTCLDAVSGESIWTYSYPAILWDNGHKGGSLSTPVVDDGYVFVKNREGKMFCLNAEDGSLLWAKDLKQLYGSEFGLWGYSSSPLILENKVIVDFGLTVALDKQTGDLIWITDDYGQAYSTPIDIEFNEQQLIAVFNKTGLVILDSETGDEQFLYEWTTFNDINASSPILLSEDRIFISSGARHGCAMLKLTEAGLEVIWESKVLQTAMNAAVLWEGHLYGFDNRIFKCIDIEGNEKWSERGIGLGAMTMADGKMLIMSDDGELIIADANPESYTELARSSVLEGGVYWTTPILVDGRIYCRNSLGDLVCRDHREEEVE